MGLIVRDRIDPEIDSDRAKPRAERRRGARPREDRARPVVIRMYPHDDEWLEVRRSMERQGERGHSRMLREVLGEYLAVHPNRSSRRPTLPRDERYGPRRSLSITSAQALELDRIRKRDGVPATLVVRAAIRWKFEMGPG